MNSIYTKTKDGWRLRASFDPSAEESAQWLADLREYFEHNGEEVRVESDAPALAALARLLDYTEPEELKHFEESDEPEDHIYRDVKTVRTWFSALPNDLMSQPDQSAKPEADSREN